jgi:tryptophan synthase beta chain
MRLFGATVVTVTTGSATLKDAINEALRDWAASYDSTHYLLGTVAGPHPFPLMVRDFQRVIGDESRRQFIAATGSLPDAVVASVGGGSNAIGIFTAFLADPVALIGVEPGGHGLDTGRHGASVLRGDQGVLHGALTLVLQDPDGQIRESHSVSAGLDYPAVGPEHADLRDRGRVEYRACVVRDAVAAYRALARAEGILTALESAHALSVAQELARSSRHRHILVNLSGRGDKDLGTIERWVENEP